MQDSDAPVTRQQQMDEDTISLIDLFAVMLRWRKLIILSTLAAVTLAVVAYVAIPPYSLAKARKERIVDVNTSVMLGSVFGDVVSVAEGTNYLLQSITDPDNVLTALRGAGYDAIEKISIDRVASKDEALFLIRSRVIENKGVDGTGLKESQRIFSYKLDRGVLTLVFRNGDGEKGSRFIQLLLEKAGAELADFAKPFAETAIESYERLLEVKNPNDAIAASIANDYRKYDQARRFVDGRLTALTSLRDPYVLVPIFSIDSYRSDWLKKGILLVFGVFFMAIFAAFVLQYIDTVRNDPESMAKIREALKKR